MSSNARWTPEEDAWLTQAYPTGYPDDLVAEHIELFGFERSAGSIQAHAAKKLGLRKDPSYNRLCGPSNSVAYSDEEIEWVRQMYAEGDIHDTLDAFEAKFGRRPAKRGMYVLANRLGLKKKRWGAAHDGRAEQTMRWSQMPNEKAWMMEHAGHPAKLQEVIDGFYEAFGITLCRSQVSLFRAAYGLSRRRSHGGGRRRVPVGTERICKGYVLVKVAEEATVAQSKDNWKLKHVHIWEQANGRECPKDWMVLFADGNRSNFDPENLVAVERRLIGPMNQAGLTWHDRESLEACINTARLKTRVNDMEHAMERTCAVCGAKFTENEKQRTYGKRVQTCPACLALGKKARGNRNAGTCTCVVCGAKFTRTHKRQQRCPDCIAALPNHSIEAHLRRKGA